MNTLPRNTRGLIATAISLALLTACSSAPTRNSGLDEARNKLAQLQSDPELYQRAPIAVQEAEAALRSAEVAPRNDSARAAHLLFMAERRVDIAWALAETRMLEDQRVALDQQRDQARLQARTDEADRARQDAREARAEVRRAERQTEVAQRQSQNARQDSLQARSDAEYARNQERNAGYDAERARQQASSERTRTAIARSDAETAQRDRADAQQAAQQSRADTLTAQRQTEAAEAQASASQRENAQMQQQIDALKAQPSDRGWVVTLGDVLFATGKAEIRNAATGDLNELARFLNRHPQRTVAIEGHTDNVGAGAANRGLSERRAESVKAFLVGQGVAASRVSTAGMGEELPVASNDSAGGRQQNRRVEVIISNNDQPEAVTSTR